MGDKKICRFCGGEIFLDKQKVVLLGTYEEFEALDESYFHYDCFVEWFDSKVKEKQKNVKPKDNLNNLLGNEGNDLSTGNVMSGMVQLGDIQKLAGSLLKGLDFGGIDIKKDAEKMTQSIKKSSEGIKKIMNKNNNVKKSKKKTGVKKEEK